MWNNNKVGNKHKLYVFNANKDYNYNELEVSWGVKSRGAYLLYIFIYI